LGLVFHALPCGRVQTGKPTFFIPKTSTPVSQQWIDFINGKNQKAIDSWQSAIQHDASLKRELQPWIEKAKARGGASRSEGQSVPEQPADG
jgi:hypothetical protein